MNNTELKLATEVKQEERLKVEKNSKGYNWEISIFIKDKTDKEALERLENLNNQMLTKFGSSTE
jgi:hypothetical protein